MLPAFIIHNKACLERWDLVKTLQEETGGIVLDAIMLPDGKEGCRKSHILAAKMAKIDYPNSYYMVFEDDCVLLKGWENALNLDFDVVYIGLNGLCEHTVFGTHALMLSPKARDLIIEEAEKCSSEVIDKGAFDHILSLLCRRHHLRVYFMGRAEQKKGLRSMITGKERL